FGLPFRVTDSTWEGDPSCWGEPLPREARSLSKCSRQEGSELIIDISTGERLQVSLVKDAGPCIGIRFGQLAEVRKRLDRAGSLTGWPPVLTRAMMFQRLRRSTSAGTSTRPTSSRSSTGMIHDKDAGCATGGRNPGSRGPNPQ